MEKKSGIDAIDLIKEVVAETEISVTESFKRRRGTTKLTINSQKKAIKNLFVALTGRKMTDEEYRQIW